jgi:lactoylglutathione lyase
VEVTSAVFDYRDLFHLGVRVPNLAAAMDEYGRGLGLVWSEVRTNPNQSIWTPERGLEQVHLTYTYSAEGPQHVELLEGPPGSFWDGTGCEGAHHVGVWVDDVAIETDRLVGIGWKVVGAQRDPGAGDGYGSFSYVEPPSGLIVELVDRAALRRFEQWWNAALE